MTFVRRGFFVGVESDAQDQACGWTNQMIVSPWLAAVRDAARKIMKDMKSWQGSSISQS